jgi:cation diffusion facilitator CzcD-associated flavoprotein CzcO
VTVESASWDDRRHVWELQLDNGRVEECNVLVSAVGFLNVPAYPDWPGLAGFAGPKFHTARWEHEHDLSGKVVAVVGTGSSATQIVPAIQPIVRQLFVFQREPGWILPKGERDLTDDDRAGFAHPWRRRRERWRQRYSLERSLWRGHLYRPGTKINEARRQLCISYIDRKFADRPDLREAVTPRYPYPGKRPIFASTFYSALKKDNVELVPRAVASVTPTGIVDADGTERPVDVIVMATGFRAADYLARVRVTGRGGRTLQEHWAGEPRAYLGITVPGFPNFFLLYGPGTNGGDIVTMLECQADYAVRAVKRMIRERVTAIEVKPSFEARWYAWLQRTMAGTSWTMSSNYFTSSTGNVVTQWPYGNVQYRVLTKLLGRVSESTRRRAESVTSNKGREQA